MTIQTASGLLSLACARLISPCAGFRTATRLAAVTSVLALWLAGTGPLAAQPVTILDGSPTCETCTLRLDTVAVIGEVEGPGVVADQARIWMGPDGRFFYASNSEPGVIKVYGPSGEFMTAFGGPGQGPGEYRTPWVYPDREIIHVLDPGQGRMTTLTADLELIDTKRVPIRGVAQRLDRSRFVISATATTPQHIGVPFHVYDYEEGAVVHSFGATSERVTLRERGSSTRRTFGVGADGMVWTAPWNHYRIERWDPAANQLLSVIEREADWFPAWDRSPPGTVLDRPPSTVLWRLSEDTQGRLWVLIHTAAEDWQPYDPARIEGEHGYISDAQYNDIYDTIFEVLVPAGDEAHLYAFARIPGRILGFVGDRTVYVYDEDESLNPRYLILRLSVRP